MLPDDEILSFSVVQSSHCCQSLIPAHIYQEELKMRDKVFMIFVFLLTRRKVYPVAGESHCGQHDWGN